MKKYLSIIALFLGLVACTPDAPEVKPFGKLVYFAFALFLAESVDAADELEVFL